MAIAYSTKDRIGVKIDDIEIKLSPLSYLQKAELQAELMTASTGDMASIMKAAFKALKFTIKEISGIKDPQGHDLKLDFEGDLLSDDCVNTLLNMEQTTKMVAVCSALIEGVPEHIMDPSTNEPLEGVTFNTGKKQI